MQKTSTTYLTETGRYITLFEERDGFPTISIHEDKEPRSGIMKYQGRPEFILEQLEKTLKELKEFFAENNIKIL